MTIANNIVLKAIFSKHGTITDRPTVKLQFFAMETVTWAQNT